MQNNGFESTVAGYKHTFIHILSHFAFEKEPARFEM